MNIYDLEWQRIKENNDIIRTYGDWHILSEERRKNMGLRCQLTNEAKIFSYLGDNDE
jgi:hypothetical protein